MRVRDKAYWEERAENATAACRLLRQASVLLRHSPNARAKVRSAIKSTIGAALHATSNKHNAPELDPTVAAVRAARRAHL